MNQREGSGNALGWRDILVLAVEVVLPAELTRSSFITFLLSRTTVVTGLGGAHLPSSYLLCGAIVVHVRGLRVGCDRRSVLLGWWWRLCMIWCSVGVCSRTDGVVVSIGYAAIGAMLVVDRPRLLVAMLHESLTLRLYIDVVTETGGSRPVLYHLRILWNTGIGIWQIL
jgi:hypothetical protein